MHRISLFFGCALLVACTQAIDHPTIRPSDSHSSSSVISSVQRSPAPRSSSATSEVGSVSSAQKPVTRNPSLATLNVPFTSQAPHANWNDPYQEACEEAAILMAVYYLEGKTFTPDSADAAIVDLVNWETENGYAQDITAAQMAEVAEKKFGLSARVRYDVTEETIKEELAAGNPVVIPAAGRDLGNPYFSGEGPWYHALTIIGFKEGWTGNYFIVNDPGTKRGEHYEYRTDVLIDAIHDWTGVKEDIRQGRKAMVILEK